MPDNIHNLISARSVEYLSLPNNISWSMDAGEFIEIKNPSVDESERSFIFSDVFPSVSLLIRIEVCTLREPLYSINGLVSSDMCVVIRASNLVIYPYPSCSGTTES
jgi:hypothetical protein